MHPAASAGASFQAAIIVGEFRAFAALPMPDPAAALRGLRHPGHRHRRHRRDHRRRADRHGGPSRRQGLHRARLHGPCAEERRGDEPCAPRAEARGPACRAHRRRRRQPGAGLRHGRGRLAGRAVARRAGRHQGGHQRPRPAGGGVRHERRHGSRRRGDDEVDPRCRGRGGRPRSSTARASPRRSWAIRSPPTSSCWAMPGRRACCRCRSRPSSAPSSSTAWRSRPASGPSPGAGWPPTTSPPCRRPPSRRCASRSRWRAHCRRSWPSGSSC